MMRMWMTTVTSLITVGSNKRAPNYYTEGPFTRRNMAK